MNKDLLDILKIQNKRIKELEEANESFYKGLVTMGEEIDYLTRKVTELGGRR